MAITFNELRDLDYIYTVHNGVWSANLGGTAVFDYFDDSAMVDDAIYFARNDGHNFRNLVVNIGTAFAAGSVTFAWEYALGANSYNAPIWASLSVTDGTNNWTHLGLSTVEFIPPADWSMVREGDRIHTGLPDSQLWIRCRITAISSPTEGGANQTDAPQGGNNTIVLTGTTEYTFDDIISADVAGGWGVATNPMPQAYKFDRCGIQVGDDAGTDGILKDNSKVIYFYAPTPSAKHGAIRTCGNSTCILGAEDLYLNKYAENGCVIYAKSNTVVYNGYISFVSDDTSTLKFHNCKFWTVDHDFAFYSGTVSWNFFLNDTATMHFIDCQVTDWGMLKTYSPNLVIKRTFFHNTYYGINLNGTSPLTTWTTPFEDLEFGKIGESGIWQLGFTEATWKNISVSPNEDYGHGLAWAYRSGISKIHMVNPPTVDANDYYVSGADDYVDLSFLFNLTVLDEDENAISGATVQLKDKDGTSIFSVPTATDGTITEQTVTTAKITTVHEKADYNPYTLTITKTGYRVYHSTFTFSENIDWTIVLSKGDTVIYNSNIYNSTIY